MNIDDSEITKEFPWLKKVLAFRNQALCIKTNIQILKDVWKLQPYFKERSTGAFYGCIQDNCIFRIILETYKMLYDTKGNSQNICGMANEVYIEMGKMDEFNDVQQKLLDMKRELKANIEKYKDVKNIIINSRKRVYVNISRQGIRSGTQFRSTGFSLRTTGSLLGSTNYSVVSEQVCCSGLYPPQSSGQSLPG
ncbi:MAG: hypothetical protein K1W25_12255 [Lachnospiraceae bacterium]